VTAIRSVMHDYYPTILVTCLMDSVANPKPSDEQLLQIRLYIQELSRQGLTDVVSVNPPKILETEYNVNVWLYPGAVHNQILTRINTSLQTLVMDQYWLGHDHSLTAIHAACQMGGVHHVDILEPTETITVPSDWIVVVTKITVTLAGRAV